MRAQTEIADFNAAFGTEFPDDEFDTVGGLVINRFGRLPKRGESVTLGGLRFQVLRADSRRLYTLIVECMDDKLERIPSATGELSYLVAPEDLIGCCTKLRDEPDLGFELLMDLCGVDYLGYGRDEWHTDEASGTGFSRGVDRDHPEQGDDPAGLPGRYRVRLDDPQRMHAALRLPMEIGRAHV